MFHLLLAMIYLAFISLGLPDAVLGSAWPSMYGTLQVPVSYMGVLTMLIAGGTIVSSLCSGYVTERLGTGKVTVISVAITAAALMGFSISKAFWQLCLFAIPYGLGAGCVDAALNNYVALHYQPRHMSWLHCFWGIGATLGPYMMGLCLSRGYGWNGGYFMIGWLQAVLVGFLFASLPLWKKEADQGKGQERKIIGLMEVLGLKGAKAVLASFFCYCALEATAGQWAGSYLVLYKGIDREIAATWASLFYLGLTLGRFACGLGAGRLGGKGMIRIGQCSVLCGILLLLWGSRAMTLVGLTLVGLGSAPIYPSLLQETPSRFGRENSQMMMGVQMASAYVGTTFVPPMFGLLAEKTTMGIYPVFLLAAAVLLAVMTWQGEGKGQGLQLHS